VGAAGGGARLEIISLMHPRAAILILDISRVYNNIKRAKAGAISQSGFHIAIV
jgi:hypothetical protein